MTSGEKWTQNLTSPNRSELTSKSSSDDIVNVEISNCPADHIFIWPFHDKIISSIVSLHKFNRWEQRHFLRTDQWERSDIAQRHVVVRNTSGWLNCMPFEYIKIHYISIWFDRMFSLNWKKSSQRSRECQWVHKNEEKTQLSLSSHWIVNLKQTVRFVNTQKSYKQEKRRQRKLFWTNNYRIYQEENSLMKTTLHLLDRFGVCIDLV